MGSDPGYYSKSVELQQEVPFSPYESRRSIDPYIEGLRLDRQRILSQLETTTNNWRRRALKLALASIESRLDAENR